jgi:orotate phosphoribosyltransferase
MSKSILHITDLHLNNFDGTDEHLRKRYYREFLDGLVNCIKESNQKVDIIVISGDFVDKGKTDNFQYISEIVEYMRSKLTVEKSNICACIGNHDFEYKKEESDGSNSNELREPYKGYSSQYNATVITSNDRASLEKLDSGIYYLSLDSTLGSQLPDRKGKPGNISEEEVDIIVNDILRENIPENNTLLIGCHYPIEVFPNSLGGVSEENWSDKHQWSQAGFLRSRINNIPNVLKIWFFGDTHFPDHLFYENALFVMTGRFGGSTNSASQLNRQCKIVNLNVGSNIENIVTYNYRMTTHEDSSMNGRWSSEVSAIRTIQTSNNDREVPVAKTPIAPTINSDNIDKISDTIEKKIIERIKNLDLYSFGRFKTSNDSTSLGWISINQLLNEQKILSSIVSKSVSRIENLLNHSVTEIAIIGLDFWGAIIGSQVSVQTGIKHFCLATRGHGQYHSNLEITNMQLEEIIPNLKGIVVFIDVISSGSTVNKTIEAIKQLNSVIEFHLISVISNNNQLKSEFTRNLNSKGTFCLDLKIPVLNNAELPDEDILPPNIDFSIKSE